jgi:hypothetical protein
MSRFTVRYAVLAGVLIAAIGGYYFFWRWAADRAVLEAANWIAAQRGDGVAIEHGPLTAGGFPYRIAVHAPAFAFTDRRNSLVVRVAGDLTATVQPWNPNHIVFQGENLTASTLPQHQTPPSATQAFRGRASAVLRGGLWQRIAVDLEKPTVAVPSGPAWSGEHLAASLRRNNGEDKERPAGSFDVSVQGRGLAVQLPPDYAFPPRIDSLNLTGQASGEWKPGPPSKAIPAWVESGGAFDFRLLDFQWDKIRADGDGTLTLDKQMRPLGAMSANVQGFTSIVDALVAGRQIRANDGNMAKIALGALAKPGAGGNPTVKVPVSAQDGRLYIGPVAAAVLPPLFAPAQ